MKKLVLKYTAAGFFLLLTVTEVMGAGSPPPPPGGDPPCFPPPCEAIPIDGGIGILAAAALAFGAKKAWDSQKNKVE